MKNKATLLIGSLCASLVGCLDSGKQSSLTESASTSSSQPAQLSVVQAASVSNADCNDGKQGAVAYDAGQNAFFVCNGGQWNAVDLRGAKGDKGDTGAQGEVGATGANGANGRNGVDGNGIRLSLRDSSNNLVGVLVQYLKVSGSTYAFTALPNGQYVYYNVQTGVPAGSTSTVLYTGPGCTGDAYTGRSDDSTWPSPIGRVYASQTEYSGVRYYQVVGAPTGHEVFQSYRSYGTLGTRGVCYYQQPSTPAPTEKIIEIMAPQSVTSLAPLQFTF